MASGRRASPQFLDTRLRRASNKGLFIPFPDPFGGHGLPPVNVWPGRGWRRAQATGPPLPMMNSVTLQARYSPLPVQMISPALFLGATARAARAIASAPATVVTPGWL